MENVFRSIGWKLMNLRQGKRLTQTEMGQQIGLSKYQVSRMEKGFGDTTLKNINKACEFFEISMDELFRKEEKVEIDMALRQEYFEKDPQGRNTKTYAKALDNLAKIRNLELPPRTMKKLRIEHDVQYEIFCLTGSPTVRTYNDSITMKPGQVISMKGQGMVRLFNIYEEPAHLMIFAY